MTALEVGMGRSRDNFRYQDKHRPELDRNRKWSISMSDRSLKIVRLIDNGFIVATRRTRMPVAGRQALLFFTAVGLGKKCYTSNLVIAQVNANAKAG